MKRPFVYIIFILLFFVAGILIANFILMPALVRTGEEITVPNVCNLPLDSAVAILKGVGLQGVVTERRYDRIIEENRIIIQEPLPDTKVKKGRIINLVVSLGVETVAIPDLSGIEYEKGRQIIERIGLVIGRVDSLISDSIPPDRIIKTIPGPEIEVKRGDEVNIVISKGKSLRMPNLLGMKISAAEEVLKTMNLNIREVIESEGSGEKGTVIVQNPEPDQAVNPGDSVSLIIIK
ncbi:MAG: PASTA domain-containing protein [candidate division WOR-3 bacterium]